jgi:hypothetical protein
MSVDRQPISNKQQLNYNNEEQSVFYVVRAEVF